jgi:LmbE family N-acetylglucosaminyl deacetylase
MAFFIAPWRSLAFLMLFPALLFAQDSIELRQAFLDLSNPSVAMDLSAHPDDEDGSTLAYLRMKLGVRTYSVLFTRGEGGQNEKGPELYEKLGVLRSRETEEAGKILGTEVQFLNFKDFGFSKTSTETFQKWGGTREVLRRLVYVIRKYKPDVVFTNHNTIDGHGNHQAVAITAIAAFDAAADSTCFPEQLREPGIALWQPRKIFFRAGWRADQPADVYCPILDTNALRGVSYVDIASEALRKHRTQGMERANLRNWARSRTAYKLMRENSLYDMDSTSFFSGIDIWRDPSIAPLRALSGQLAEWHFGMSRDSLIQGASSVLRQLESIGATSGRSPFLQRIVTQWRVEIERIVALQCGVQASIVLADSVIVGGQEVKCDLRMASRECSVSDVRVRFMLPHGWSVNRQAVALTQAAAEAATDGYAMHVGADAVPTLPREVAQYSSLERHQDVIARIDYLLNGKPMTTEVSPIFDVAPAQWLSVTPGVAGYMPGRSGKEFSFAWQLTSFALHGESGLVTAHVPHGWKATRSRFDARNEDDTASGRIEIEPPPGVKPGVYDLRFAGAHGSASVPVNVFDVKVAQKINLGIITSYDNTLEAAAGELHVPYQLLSDNDIEKGDLARFTTIIIDIRAYLVREGLKKFNNRLLDYVREGGNLVVMYQRDQEWKPEYAPFPFQITRKRITIEEAPVTILTPEHPLMSTPNRIGDRDWEGWTQERGLYFPGNVAPEYTRLLSSSDPDEEPLTTGYLVAKVGKGSYIYTSYVWYRELKEANPGAFRCFANMISYSTTR